MSLKNTEGRRENLCDNAKIERNKNRKEIENSTKLFRIQEELAEKKARIDACKRFEEEFGPLPLQDDDEESCAQDHIASLESQLSSAYKFNP